MGITKTQFYTEQQNQLALYAKVLGHPARIAIVQEVMTSESCICGDLVTKIGLSQPTISQHLKELKRIGILQGNVSGTSVCYCLNTQTWDKLKNAFETLFSSDSNSTCC